MKDRVAEELRRLSMYGPVPFINLELELGIQHGDEEGGDVYKALTELAGEGKAEIIYGQGWRWIG